MTRIPIDLVQKRTRVRQDLGDIDSLVESIGNIGCLQPLVVTTDYRLIAGERRLEAMRMLNYEDVPVTIVDSISDARTKIVAERDENTCRKDLTPIEMYMFGQILEEIESPQSAERMSKGAYSGGRGNVAVDFDEDKGTTRDKVGDAMGISGRKYDQIKRICESGHDDLIELMEEDSVKAAYKKLKLREHDKKLEKLVDETTGPSDVTKLGDKWEARLGKMWEIVSADGERKHRLLCGDSTDPKYVKHVNAGIPLIDLTLTDPPYSVNYDKSFLRSGGNLDVHGEYIDPSDASDVLVFMKYVPSSIMVWTYPIDKHFAKLAKAYEDSGWRMWKSLVWVKDSFNFWPGAKYQQKFEPVQISLRYDRKSVSPDNIPSDATTVINIPRKRSHDLHPTERPIELWDMLMRYHSNPGNFVFDPFMGSGTTLAVAENLGRTATGIERAPGFCGVILERMQRLGCKINPMAPVP